MSVESWARRASGLLVPTMGFAHPLGRFQPCAEPCCEKNCEDCGETMINGIWVDIPPLVNNGCVNCEDIEMTSFWLSGTNCGAGSSTHYTILCDPEYVWLMPYWFLSVSYVVRGPLYKCFLRCEMIWHSLTGTLASRSYWELELTSFADPLDHYLPFLETIPNEFGAVYCDAEGTEIHVYI